jgi:hypothetical protein
VVRGHTVPPRSGSRSARQSEVVVVAEMRAEGISYLLLPHFQR